MTIDKIIEAATSKCREQACDNACKAQEAIQTYIRLSCRTDAGFCSFNTKIEYRGFDRFPMSVRQGIADWINSEFDRPYIETGLVPPKDKYIKKVE